MRLLLDTHSLLWALDGSLSKLSPSEVTVISDCNNIVCISTASLWELSIKLSIGKLTLPENFFTVITSIGYEILDIKIHHIIEYASFPLIHRDPFDRILIAQARCEGLILVSHDELIKSYDVQVL
ncbi:type II toxin-antitoxin system VapC family toxin [Gloeocapsa sp. PCC 73106]|uniref:type II toxin-antitoxin system VapC family toxin n=1 Tax=Gloeocapsa sp. PCC 73106 TaxID=102232 RepID=UPI0002AC1FB8|nr:type II toxin-antitoxin system VapC family toxin [Gloeocapsa sp. PCC 73106]ELR98840.1 hypothetical protein GLO73106DRAFT_00026780 [Gloeocapsa sp. PCC 73106]